MRRFVGPVAAAASPLRGLVQATLQMRGALDTMLVSGTFAMTDVSRGTLRAPSVVGTLTWLGGARPQLSTEIDADSLHVGRLQFTRARAAVSGWSDSLQWSGGVHIGDLSDLALDGRWVKRDSTVVWTLDRIDAQLARHRWGLAAPAVLTALFVPVAASTSIAANSRKTMKLDVTFTSFAVC